jgi:hypothetical protein
MNNEYGASMTRQYFLICLCVLGLAATCALSQNCSQTTLGLTPAIFLCCIGTQAKRAFLRQKAEATPSSDNSGTSRNPFVNCHQRGDGKMSLHQCMNTETEFAHKGKRFALVLCLALCFADETHAQLQTYTLETSTFRLVFNRFNRGGYATGIRECRYLPTGQTFLMHERPTSIANTDSSWHFPDSVSVVQTASNIQELTIYFRPGKSITMRTTSHAHFLEFELMTVNGNCGELWLFGPIFLGLSPSDWPGWDPIVRNEYNQITYIGSGYYACFLAANANTYPARDWSDSTSVFVRVISPRYLPMRDGSSYRNQRFAFFICREEHLKNRIREVEQYFDIPYGSALKDNIENDIDYLFLLDTRYVPAENIIQLCRETNLGAVLLYQYYWSAWTDTTEAFKFQRWTKNVVDSLKAAGLIVGLHAYVHSVPKEGYYATHYPDSVHTCVVDNIFKPIKWTTMLPEMIVQDFVDKVEALRPQWLYFDSGPLDSCKATTNEAYLEGRLTWAVMKELRKRNYDDLKIFQDAHGTLTYPFKSRIGQTDYWDGVGWHRNPTEHMNFTASQVIHRRRGLYRYTDLGWFGREIHIPGGRRDARRGEWDTLALISVSANIPIGIRTTYNDFMSDTLYGYLVPLLRETIRQRRNLTVVEDKEHSTSHFTLHQNYPNPFNPSTTIRFSLPQREHVILKVFDMTGREVARLVDGNLVAGNHVVTFAPREITSGLYFYKIIAGKFSQTRKAILVK